MIEKFNIPEEHHTAFRRLLRILPDGFREDESKMQTLVVYLKLGGEKLARQRLELAKRPFQREYALFKRVTVLPEGRPEEDAENDSDLADDDGHEASNDVDAIPDSDDDDSLND